jgi:hypothetical protein
MRTVPGRVLLDFGVFAFGILPVPSRGLIVTGILDTGAEGSVGLGANCGGVPGDTIDSSAWVEQIPEKPRAASKPAVAHREAWRKRAIVSSLKMVDRAGATLPLWETALPGSMPSVSTDPPRQVFLQAQVTDQEGM